MPPQLSVRGLRKTYGAFVAVKSFDLDIAQREFVSLVGPSGCGKSTILRMIAGLIEPDSGTIELGGEDITWRPVHKRELGLVFQSYALFPHLSVFENVAFGLRRRRPPEAEIRTRVNEALEIVRLDALGERFPRQLSGGQQQRVALARSVVTKPNLLLLDEPLSNLDALLRDEMRLELKRLQHELGVSTLFVTHDQSEALAMSDRIAVLNAGLLEQVGTPEEIYNAPSSAFVASFVGRSNFLSGEVSAIDDRLVAVNASGLTIHVARAGVRLNDKTVSVGQKVRVAVRYERVHVTAVNAYTDDCNSFPGKVVVRAFAGASSQYLVKLDNGQELQIDRPREGEAIGEGAPVTVQWSPEDAIIVAREEAR